MSFLPFLLMSLDLAQDEDSLNMPLIWSILLIVQVISVWVLYPILIVYYESNENDGLVSVPTCCVDFVFF